MKIKRGSTTLYESGQWDHGSPYALHMGLRLVAEPDLIIGLTGMVADFYEADAPFVFVDGDGWNCWGEDVGTDLNDADTYHVVIPVKSPREGQKIVAHLLDFNFGHLHLAPIRDSLHGEDQVPVIAVITDGRDWSMRAHSLSWEYGMRGETTPSGVYFSMWPRGRKAYHIEISEEEGVELEDWLFSRSAEIVDVEEIESGRPAVKTNNNEEKNG